MAGILFLGFFLASCDPDEGPGGNPPPDNDVDLTHIPYNPTPYDLEIPPGFPEMHIPPDNPLTQEGVELGRFLFFDPILSGDSTQSCGTCHMPKGNFTDNQPVSEGITGALGSRSAMPLSNIGFANNGLFWDGRAPTLEEQALQPVENPIEMAAEWEDVEERLRRHPVYQEMFRKAFGIQKASEIDRFLAAKAIAQFQRTLISAGSKFDRKVLQNDPSVFFTDLETDGFLMFFDKGQSLGFPDAECFHCHNEPLFTTEEYKNNGLDSVPDLNSFPDKGRGEVTGKVIDNGTFRIPTLRNIALSAPYMHDGRFQTLEEVLEHYNSGGHFAPNVDAGFIRPLGLTEYQKEAIIAFLHTLTDTSFINNPAFQNPFE